MSSQGHVILPGTEKLVPSSQESLISGGTADQLPNERKKASFNTQEMHYVLAGGKKAAARRKFIMGPVKDQEWYPYEWDRHEYFSESVRTFIEVHKEWGQKGFIPTRADLAFMTEAAQKYSALSNHYFIFVPGITNLGTDEQKRYWLPKAMRFEIIGNYCQTELGHGSNVRGLSTTAVYDKNTQEFVLNTPTLRSIKWWPGALGKASSHALVYAQLIIDGQEKGLHTFILQLRDENFKPLPGIELGDLGTKMGDNANDTGYMILQNVRIPRTFMLMKHAEVTPEGKFISRHIDPKVHYATMMFARTQFIGNAGVTLARAATIAIRYNAVRLQGFIDNSAKSYKSPESALIDFKSQQYRLFKQLSISYAFKFCMNWMIEHVKAFEGEKATGEVPTSQGLQEIAVTSGGLKALNSFEALKGSEDLRKCCGGNGYLLHSGIAILPQNFAWVVTAEGDYIILLLLLARFLLKGCQSIKQNKKMQGIFEYLNEISKPGFTVNNVPQVTVENLMNPEYQLNLFKIRAQAHVLEVTQQFEEQERKGLNFDQAWIQCQRKLLQAARSHCWYVNMYAFYQYYKAAEDQKCKKVLGKLISLFGCSNILDDHWQNVLNKRDYLPVQQAIDVLLDEIRPEAVCLVDAFDFPDNILMSSIGSYDGNVYERLLACARKSNLNQHDPFIGYEKVLKPHLDQQFLKKPNKWLAKM